MRAIAVLLVMFNHAGFHSFAGGYIGVDVFFVISGFLITGILAREVRRTGRISIPSFYARRARRILPAATVALLAIVGASSLVFTVARLHTVLTQAIWAAFFASNIYSAKSGSDYFATQDTFVSPIVHFWSLAVEEQFYLVWPPIIAVILFATRRRPTPAAAPEADLDSRAAQGLRRLTVALAVLCVLSFAWSVRQTTTAPTWAYYSPLTRGWELGAGALLALSAARVARWARPLKLAASWVGLAAIVVAAVAYSSATPFPGYHAALPVLGAVLLLAGGIDGPAHGARLVLDTPPMRWIGDISYSLYLWHWPYLLLPSLYLTRQLTVTERVALLAAATLTAWLSYRFIETPALRSPRLTRSRFRSLMLWPAAVSVVVAAALLANTTATTDRPSVPQHFAGTNTDPAINAVTYASELAKSHQPLPANLRPTLTDLHADVSELPAGCGVERDDPKVSTCVLGDPNGKHTMVLFGDSHVIMWLQPLEHLAKAHSWRIIPVEKASCFPLNATQWRDDKARAYTECDAWRSSAYTTIAKLKPDRIIISGLAPPALVDPTTGRPAHGAAKERLFDNGVRSSLTKLHALAPHIDVIGATPQLARTSGDCLGTRSATMASCARPVANTITRLNRDWQTAAAAHGAKFIDPVPWLCANHLCPIVVGNVIVYRDTNHITRTFADTLQTELATRLDL